jgi:hypothetical protein
MVPPSGHGRHTTFWQSSSVVFFRPSRKILEWYLRQARTPYHILSEFFGGFPQDYQENVGMVPASGTDAIPTFWRGTQGILYEFFGGFPQDYQENVGMVPSSGHARHTHILAWDTGNSVRDLRWFSSGLPGKCWNGTFIRARTPYPHSGEERREFCPSSSVVFLRTTRKMLEWYLHQGTDAIPHSGLGHREFCPSSSVVFLRASRKMLRRYLRQARTPDHILSELLGVFPQAFQENVGIVPPSDHGRQIQH